MISIVHLSTRQCLILLDSLWLLGFIGFWLQPARRAIVGEARATEMPPSGTFQWVLSGLKWL